MTCLIETANPEKPSRIQFRMAWRLMLCLFGHLALLFFLALYLVASLNQVQLYTPEARADEVQLESVKAVPAILAAMNTQRLSYQKNGDPHDLALYQQARAALQSNLDSLHTPLILPSDLESQRRALVRKWVSEIGDYAADTPKPTPAQLDALNSASNSLLGQSSGSSSRTCRGRRHSRPATASRRCGSASASSPSSRSRCSWRWPTRSSARYRR